MSAVNRRFAITGIGLISPLGNNVDALRANLGQATDGRCDFNGHIDDFGDTPKNTKRVIRKSLKLMNRETQLGVAAAQRAFNDSGLANAGYPAESIGVLFGAGDVAIQPADFADGVQACLDDVGELDLSKWGQLGIAQIDPLWILRVLPNMPACHIAIANDLQGINNTITQSTVAANMALSEAIGAITDGDADVVVVGGTGNCFHDFLNSASTANQPAEAAGAFVVERMDLAIDREARIYADVLATAEATSIRHDYVAEPKTAIRFASETALQKLRWDALNAPPQAQRYHTAEMIGDAGAGTSALDLILCLDDIYSGRQQCVQQTSVSATGLASCVIVGQHELRRSAA